MTDWDISIEYEAFLSASGETLKTCPRCKRETHRSYCDTCTLPDGSQLELSGDVVMDEAIAKIESGEDVDLEAILSSGFEPIPRQ